MPAFLIRNIPKKTHQAIKKRAQRHGNSTEAELRLIVEEVARQEATLARVPGPEVGLGTQLREIGLKYGGWDLDIQRDKRPLEPFTFE